MLEKKFIERLKKGMTVKELKRVLNSHKKLDNSQVRVLIERNGGGTIAKLVGVDVDWVRGVGPVVFLSGLDEKEEYTEIQDNYCDAKDGGYDYID